MMSSVRWPASPGRVTSRAVGAATERTTTGEPRCEAWSYGYFLCFGKARYVVSVTIPGETAPPHVVLDACAGAGEHRGGAPWGAVSPRATGPGLGRREEGAQQPVLVTHDGADTATRCAVPQPGLTCSIV
jgi:hypothetical protein